MSKYIDTDKLKELINEKWQELADKNVKVGGGKWDAEISTYLSVLRLIDSLQQEQLSLPSNLDEAAKEYELSIGSQDYCYMDVIDAFKAGAEWMAGQGETFNGFISFKGEQRSLIAIEGKSEYKFGDKVIVQIRKK